MIVSLGVPIFRVFTVTVVELGHNDHLKIYIDSTKSYAEQNSVTFTQYDLQMELFQIYVIWQSKMAVSCCC